MIKKLVLPVFALIGIGAGIFMIVISRQKPPVAKILFPPPQPPYEHFVSGSGIIEAASENIKIGTAFPDLVTDIYVSVGEKVKKDDPLFRLDIRQLEADLHDAMAKTRTAKENMEDRRVQFYWYQKLKDKRAVSEDEYNQKYYAYETAKKEAEQAIAQEGVIKMTIERSMIRAPMDGEILQVNVKLGQFANVNPFDKKPLMLFGNLDVYHVRIDVDEEDAWRVVKEAPAMAYVRGNSSIQIPLEFVKIEPYVVPKVSLTSDNQERVDTRVLQVIYRFKRDHYPVYVGQLMDVYIEALPSNKKYYEIKYMDR